MLFDPKWEVEVRADPFSLESLIAWLEKQPAGATYDYCDSQACLIAQYLKAQGVAEFSITSPMLSPDPAIQQFARIANGGRPIDTFGEALERARSAVSLHHLQSDF